jgi:sirohydrochlorin ferrochelatase
MAQIMQMVERRLPEALIDCAYLQLSEATVEKAVARLAGQGASEIRVVPYFLFSGVHLREDIPQMLSELAGQYPNIAFSLGEHLGVDERLVDILVDRIGA